jgi:hypothetical protein
LLEREAAAQPGVVVAVGHDVVASEECSAEESGGLLI